MQVYWLLKYIYWRYCRDYFMGRDDGYKSLGGYYCSVTIVSILEVALSALLDADERVSRD